MVQLQRTIRKTPCSADIYIRRVCSIATFSTGTAFAIDIYMRGLIVRKPVLKTALIFCLLLSGAAHAITAPELFNDGKRAFNNGRWQECEEVMTRLIKSFPEHILTGEGMYFKTIASIRNHENTRETVFANMASEWKKDLEQLKKDFPRRDFSELEIAIKIAGNKKPETWNHLEKLSPSEVKQYINRNWHPEPQNTPKEALVWATRWLKKHTPKSIEPELLGKISLIKAKSMWNFLLSPLSMYANSDILKVCELWPVHTHIEQTLITGFESGNSETKREIALLGFHYDYFKLRGVVRSDLPAPQSRWLIYLTERGLNHQEAWIPR